MLDIDTGALNGPHGLTVVGGKLYFTAEGAKATASLDIARRALSSGNWLYYEDLL